MAINILIVITYNLHGTIVTYGRSESDRHVARSDKDTDCQDVQNGRGVDVWPDSEI